MHMLTQSATRHVTTAFEQLQILHSNFPADIHLNLLLLGESGLGKTTFIYQLLHSYAPAGADIRKGHDGSSTTMDQFKRDPSSLCTELRPVHIPDKNLRLLMKLQVWIQQLTLLQKPCNNCTHVCDRYNNTGCCCIVAGYTAICDVSYWLVVTVAVQIYVRHVSSVYYTVYHMYVHSRISIFAAASSKLLWCVAQDMPGWGDDINVSSYARTVAEYVIQQRAADYDELQGHRSFPKANVSGCLKNSVTACLYFLPPHRTKPVSYSWASASLQRLSSSS